MDFCSQTDIPALPVSVRRTAPSWQPVSREEPIGKRSDGSPPSWGTRPPNRWEGVEPQCAGGDAQSVKVDSVFPLGEPSLPAPHQPLPLPKVHFLFLKWLANQHAGSSCQLKAGPGADRCAPDVLLRDPIHSGCTTRSTSFSSPVLQWFQSKDSKQL